MNQRIVERRYVTGAAICAALYLALAYGGKLAIRSAAPHGLLLYAMALAPAVPIVGFFFIFARYLGQLDEYRRHRLVQALLISLAVALSIGCGWDFLQAYGGAPAPQPFVLTSSFMLLFGVIHAGLQIWDKVDARRGE